MTKMVWTWGVGDFKPRRVPASVLPEDRVWPTRKAALDARNYNDKTHSRYFDLLHNLERENPSAFMYFNGPILWESQVHWALYLRHDLGIQTLSDTFMVMYSTVAKAKEATAHVLEQGASWKRNPNGTYSAMCLGGSELTLHPSMINQEIHWTEKNFTSDWTRQRDAVIDRAKVILESMKRT